MNRELLYIHGYNSSGSKGRILEKLLDGYCKVHHFSISSNPDDAYDAINSYLKNNSGISLIVGSSLGGFIASRMNGYLKLLINPCMYPSVELPKIGCEKEVSDKYIKYENYEFLDGEERLSTYLMFATNDELFSYRCECENMYLKKNISIMEGVGHKLSEEDLVNFVVPKIKEIFEVESPLISKYLENS